MFVSNRKSSVVIAADESTISWGPSPTFGELVRHETSIWLNYFSVYTIFNSKNVTLSVDYIFCQCGPHCCL